MRYKYYKLRKTAIINDTFNKAVYLLHILCIRTCNGNLHEDKISHNPRSLARFLDITSTLKLLLEHFFP